MPVYTKPFVEMNHYYPSFLRWAMPCEWRYPVCTRDPGACKVANKAAPSNKFTTP